MAAHNTQATGAGTNNFGVWAGDGLGARLAANRKLILIGALIGLAVVVIIVAIVTAVVLLGGSSSAAVSNSACSSTTCLNGGSCSDPPSNITCVCQQPFIGVFCETDSSVSSTRSVAGGRTTAGGGSGQVTSSTTNVVVTRAPGDVCPDYPCENGGTCYVTDWTVFACACAHGFTDTLCTTVINYCQSSPCANGGTCNYGPNYVQCQCMPQFTGTFCQMPVATFCSSNPCQNGGACSNIQGCTCTRGWAGLYCTDNDNCLSQPCINNATCITTGPTYMCNCIAGFSGINCEINDYKIIFAVQSSTSTAGGSSPLVFDRQAVSYGGGFPTTSISTYTCPKNGTYWLFYTAVVPGSTQINYSLHGNPAPQSTTLCRTHTSFNGTDTISRQVIRQQNAQDTLYLTSAYPTFADATTGPSWAALRLDQLMNPLYAFDVGLNVSSVNVIVYNLPPYTNLGSAWATIQKAFYAQQTGVYYLSFTFSVPTRTVMYAFVYTSISQFQRCTMRTDDNTHVGTDVISRGCLLELQATESFAVYYTPLGSSSASCGQTSVRGFLYSPTHGQTAVWAVGSNTPQSGSTALNNMVSFEKVYTNTIPPNSLSSVKIWYDTNPTTGTIPVSGIYFVELVVTSSSTISTNMDLTLVVGNNPVFRLLFATPVTCSTRSRSSLVRAYSGQQMSVTMTTDTMIDGCTTNGALNLDPVSFNGFLLYPDT